MPDKKRFLKNLDINFISLVDKAANQKVVIYKSADPTKNTHQKTVSIVKVDEDKREVTGIVYEPDVADSDGDYTNADEIKKAAYLFMKNRKTTNIDKQHDENGDEGFVAESWIVQKDDARLPDAKEGSWAVLIKVENDETWEGVKSGEITGLSMGGVAVAEQVQKNDSSDTFFEKLLKTMKDGFSSIKKDFNSQWNHDQLNRMTWALTDAIRDVLEDDEVEDKKAKILENLEQFKTAVESYDFNKTAKPKVSKTKNEENKEMTPEEITKLVEETVNKTVSSKIDEGFNSINENIDKMKTDFNEKAGAFEERLEKVEKSTDGSVQDNVTAFEKNKDYKGIGWLS